MIIYAISATGTFDPFLTIHEEKISGLAFENPVRR